MTYLECWAVVARGLFAQALTGEPELVDSLPRPMEAGSFGFAATLEGEQAGPVFDLCGCGDPGRAAARRGHGPEVGLG